MRNRNYGELSKTKSQLASIEDFRLSMEQKAGVKEAMQIIDELIMRFLNNED